MKFLFYDKNQNAFFYLSKNGTVIKTTEPSYDPSTDGSIEFFHVNGECGVWKIIGVTRRFFDGDDPEPIYRFIGLGPLGGYNIDNIRNREKILEKIQQDRIV